jgi:hypothetical protein
MREKHIVMCPALFGKVTDSTENYRPVLSLKRALHTRRKKQLSYKGNKRGHGLQKGTGRHDVLAD